MRARDEQADERVKWRGNNSPWLYANIAWDAKLRRIGSSASLGSLNYAPMANRSRTAYPIGIVDWDYVYIFFFKLINQGHISNKFSYK